MPPIVAKVVDVNHRVAFDLQEFADRHLAFILQLQVAKFFRFRRPPVFAFLLELMEMAVPQERNGQRWLDQTNWNVGGGVPKSQLMSANVVLQERSGTTTG